MYNRYQGNTGRVTRVNDDGKTKNPPPPPRKQSRTAAPPPPKPSGSGLLDALGGFLPKKLEGFETEDLLLLMILYLMFRESGDKEMLIIMGAMFLL